MTIAYWIVIKIYGLLIYCAFPFHAKARAWVNGRRNIYNTIRATLQDGEKRIWFHCSSYGEFEQGKPVLDALRKEYVNYKIVLTFFSPSGYRLKKNDPAADYVFYMPLDGPANSKRFIDLVNPSLVFFVKYDFWHFYIKTLKDKKIPMFIISALFRPSQIFFRPYGIFFRKIVQRVTHLFVQNQTSLQLLYKNKLPNVTVSGDTRFDRVYINSRNRNSIPLVEEFKNGQSVFIAGSTWPDDEKRIIKLIKVCNNDWKFIIVPHEINKAAVLKLKQQFNEPALLYSELNAANCRQAKVLIMDNLGMLSNLYAYGNIAYLGGGFGKGIHNILEAVVFGLPVIFGPNYRKSQEAVDLIRMKTVFTFSRFSSLLDTFITLVNDEEQRKKIADKNIRYIESKRGATDIIMNYLKMNHIE